VYDTSATKDIIKTNFLLLYDSKPLGSITVNEIARTCSISRSTFYFYFEDIQALYRQCESDVIDFLEEELEDIITYTVNMDPDAYAAVFQNFLTKVKAHRKLCQSFLKGSELGHFHDVWVHRIAQRYLKAARFSKGNAVQNKYFARFFASGKISILTTWIMDDCKDSIEDIANISAKVLFDGVFDNRC